MVLARAVADFALAAVVCQILGCGGGDGSADAAVSTDGALCTPEDHRACQEDNSHWVDSCDNLGELIEVCSGERPCTAGLGRCCRPAATQGSFLGAPILAEVELALASAAAELDIDFDVQSFSLLGQAQALVYSGAIDDRAFEVSLTADLADSGPATGSGISFRGAVGNEDPESVEYGSPVFFSTSSDDGGTVQLSYPLLLLPRTTVAARLTREEGAGAADWYALRVSIDDGSEELLGRILFPRNTGQASSLDGTSYLRGLVVRDNSFDLADLGKVGVSASVPQHDGVPADSGSLSYPEVMPSAEPFPNVDVSFEPATARIVVTQGGLTPKCTDGPSLF